MRIPKGVVSDFVDERGNGVYLRELFYRNLGSLEAQKFFNYSASRGLTINDSLKELKNHPFEHVFARELRKEIRKSRKIVILCEGDTEVYYFRELITELHAGVRVRIKKGTHTDPWQLVREAEEIIFFDLSHENELLEVWVVFDRDSHLTYSAAFEEARKYPQIKLAWSNPCFEFWFLLHYRKSFKDFFRSLKIQNPLTSQEEVLYDQRLCFNKLKSLLPTYSKADRFIFHTLRARTPRAIELSRMNQTNPNELGSAVGLLIERLDAFLIIQKNFWSKYEPAGQAPKPLKKEETK